MSLSAVAFAEVDTKIGLITMDQMDVHWVRLQQAAQAKVDELNKEGNKIEMVWMAPETKDNQQQIEKIQAAVADGVNYIIIACNDSTSANRALQEAKDAGIKLMSDSNIAHVESGELLAFMAQNPNIMGEMAIEAVVELEGGKDLGGATVDTGVSVVDAANVADFK